MKAYTTIEESKRLIEAGLDVDTADMIFNVLEQVFVRYNIPIDEFHKPCWSLVALLNIIDNNNIIYDISNDKNREYKIIIYSPDYIKQELKFYHTENTIVDMIVWLLEKNYIKSNKNEQLFNFLFST